MLPVFGDSHFVGSSFNSFIAVQTLKLFFLMFCLHKIKLHDTLSARIFTVYIPPKKHNLIKALLIELAIVFVYQAVKSNLPFVNSVRLLALSFLFHEAMKVEETFK